jgi:copper chaperone CopZ
MIRRKFIGLMALAGAGSMVALETVDNVEQKTVTYRISGFTCVTCAVGLETLLQKERGVVWAKASYPSSTATITYHPKLTSESSLVKFIESAGFKAEEEV